ncbi:MAG: HIT domain-containing protein, partial [Chloroflexi bacterium]|nr:HIT domain-containing protein [Chloroflexota bacterium]
DEAIRFNHNYIGTEHLLLGLVREGEGVAARVLDQMGIQLSAIRRSVEASTGRGTSVAPSEIFLSPGVKRVIELAGEEAKNLGHSHVGTENLLLGMIRHEDEKSPARLVLANLGVDLEATRQRVIDTLAHPETIRRVAAVEGSMLDAQGKKRDWYCEDVLSGKLKVKVLYEDELVLGMEHPHPTYQIHGVVIPKKHVSSLLAPEALDPALLASMLRGVQAVAKALGLDQQGFRMEANAAGPGVTPHMHWHVAGPGLPPPMRWKARAIGPVAATPRSAGFTFDRFDDGAKRVLALAQEEAIRLNHNYIGTEHLLAGLVRESSSAAARALLTSP